MSIVSMACNKTAHAKPLFPSGILSQGCGLLCLSHILSTLATGDSGVSALILYAAP